MNGKNIKWITIRGNHIPIKMGQSVEEAIKERFGEADFENDLEEFDDLEKDLYEGYKSLSELPEKRKEGKTSVNDDSKACYDRYINYVEKDESRENNCQKMTACMELRARGYNVLPAPFNPYYSLNKENKVVKKESNTEGYGLDSFFNINKKEYRTILYRYEATASNKSEAIIFTNSRMKEIGMTIPQFTKQYLKDFPNSRWALSVKWKNKNEQGTHYGHVFNVNVDKNGKVSFIDSQRDGEKITWQNTWLYITSSVGNSTQLRRIDNRKINENLLDTYIYREESGEDEY